MVLLTVGSRSHYAVTSTDEFFSAMERRKVSRQDAKTPRVRRPEPTSRPSSLVLLKPGTRARRSLRRRPDSAKPRPAVWFSSNTQLARARQSAATAADPAKAGSVSLVMESWMSSERRHAERRTPNAERRTPNAERQTPNAKRRTPNAVTPNAATPVNRCDRGLT
jgi:hypothetical protein